MPPGTSCSLRPAISTTTVSCQCSSALPISASSLRSRRPTSASPSRRRRRRASAFSRRTRSSTTSASARRASHAPTAAASQPRSSTPSSAALRRRGSSRRSARSAGWRTPVYTFAGQYSDTGQVGVYVGTREENLEPCLDIVAEQIADIAAGNISEAELERAKENLKGRIVLSHGVDVEPDEQARQGADHGHGDASLDRVIAEIDAVEPSGVAELAGVLLAPEAVSAAGIGPSEDRFLAAVEQVHPGCRRRPQPRRPSPRRRRP